MTTISNFIRNQFRTVIIQPQPNIRRTMLNFHENNVKIKKKKKGGKT